MYRAYEEFQKLFSKVSFEPRFQDPQSCVLSGLHVDNDTIFISRLNYRPIYKKLIGFAQILIVKYNLFYLRLSLLERFLGLSQ